MFNPVSTYRLQFHKDFTLSDLEAIIPYLKNLGVNTVYASPVFGAVPGSTHGYDQTDPNKINPETGTIEQLKAIHQSLQTAGINWIQDIVPNHMAFLPDNPWITDILEKGALSLFAKYFDTPLSSELYQGRLMVPFLGSSLNDAVEKGELRAAWENNRLVLKYFDTSWPLNIRSYEIMLTSGPELPSEAFRQLLSLAHQLHEISDPESFAPAMDEFRIQLAALAADPQNAEYLNNCIESINAQKPQLLQIAEHQVYRLCHWEETDSRINFRRFFTVNGLICLNLRDEEVFRQTHLLIKSMLDEGIFKGLRVDHIDGLYDPASYLEQLRKLAGDQTYIVAEKILESKEQLPEGWPLQGTTGYDFLAMVNNLFTNKSSKKTFSRLYRTISGNNLAIKQQIRDKKKFILYQHMAGELDNLTRIFAELKLADRQTLNAIGHEDLKKAISEFLVYCPVYRYYGNRFPLSDKEAQSIQGIFRKIRDNNQSPDAAVDLLEDVFLHKPKLQNSAYNSSALRFYQLCMQLTGPLMAKGVEDTLMYSYNRFIGHNEVGNSPQAFGITVAGFHEQMFLRQQKWPLTLNATATHDTKRGEDVRARLNVLTDLPDEWLKTVEQWRELNKALKQHDFPDDNDEYFIYQTLIGAHPMPGQDEDHFVTRLQEYLEKALREAKLHSSWSSPNSEYENGAKSFAASLLDRSKPFWSSFKPLLQKVAGYGIINSLSQVLLKFTCPGIPDVYQGCELWDLSLVDPDNRRPVDFAARQTRLKAFAPQEEESQESLSDLWQNRFDGRIKLWLTQQLFRLRKQDPETFEKGDYIPLQVKGRHKEHIMAFARRYQQSWYVIAVPLHAARLCERQQKDILQLNWKNTRIMLPEEATLTWDHLIAETAGNTADGIAVGEVFKDVPFAILKLGESKSNRSAGVLMHITSLPSAYGTGDLGPGAMDFAQFLSRSCQKYWQILPLTPTEMVNGHSPYSSFSSMAGNTLLISLDLLARDGLLDEQELIKYQIQPKAHANYRETERIKDRLFEKAWRNFKQHENPDIQTQFETFCRCEAYWLDDFALYLALKQAHEGKAWYDWPAKFKRRNENALKQFAEENHDSINKIKWLQFIFTRQWNALKDHCNNLNIKVIGDLPFYVSYDSVDVWSSPEIFSLDRNMQMETVAGVPPDYFNDNGQLWGMPVFRWDKLKESGYEWWIRRIKKNLELYDLLRLDHFRAFSEYWAVPSQEKTAINGGWQPGPGSEFFHLLQNKLGELPFIAEDLGDIDDAVHQLRDKFQLPGMKILQFAFGDDLPSSAYIPHNYTSHCIVYTGTHDNNTVTGWLKKEAGKTARKQVKAYTGIKVTRKNINSVLGRMAYASVAKTVILPVQDICGLDERSRMNTPASVEKNWLWRLLPGELTPKHEQQLRDWVRLYGRM